MATSTKEIADLLTHFGLLDDAQAAELARITDLPVEDLTLLRDRIVAAARDIDTSAPSIEDIEALSAAAAGAKAISAEFTRRTGEAGRRAAVAAELVAALTATADTPPPGSPRPPSISRLAQRRPARNRPVPRGASSARVLTAAGTPAAEGLVETISDGLRRRWSNPVRKPSDGPEKVTLATIRVDYPEDRHLGQDEVVNAARLDAVTSPAALTASGGICGPVGVSYDVLGWSVADTPVQAALAQFGATRGGIRFTPPHTLTQVTADGPAGLWTSANDANPTNPTVKTIAVFTCEAVQEIVVDAVTSMVKFGEFSNRFHPEAVAAYLQTAAAVHARLAEATTRANIAAASIACTADEALLGTVRDLLATIDRASAAIRYRNRTAVGAPLRLIMPQWLFDQVRADVARELPGDSGGQSERLAVADAEIMRWFDVRGINVTGSLDSPTGAAVFQGFGTQSPNQPLNAWPAKARLSLFPEGSFLFLDGGELNLGFIRDSVLAKTNDLLFFAENFQQVAFVGVESLEITAQLAPTGLSAGTINTTPYLVTTGS